MKIAETCVCGASVEIEHDDPHTAAATVDTWRDHHRCMGNQPWRQSARSTTASSIERAEPTFGFGLENQVISRA